MFVWIERRFLHVRPIAFTSMLDGAPATFVRAQLCCIGPFTRSVTHSHQESSLRSVITHFWPGGGCEVFMSGTYAMNLSHLAETVFGRARDRVYQACPRRSGVNPDQPGRQNNFTVSSSLHGRPPGILPPGAVCCEGSRSPR